jgi:aldose 1-epimerase
MKRIALLVLSSVTLMARNYKAEQTTDHGVPVVRLSDSASGVQVSILPSLGNRAYEMKVHGKNILYLPDPDVTELLKKPGLNGIPFLAPWANRLDQQGFWANEKNYNFNPNLGNVRGPLPIHGLLSNSSLWHVTEAAADTKSAHVTSRLEYWKYPDLMAQWPFAHDYEMTYTLTGGTLEVKITVTNLSTEKMPVSVGFHPYYRIPDVPRDQWATRLPTRKIVVTDTRLIPTGELRPFDLPNPVPLKDHPLDTGFTDLERDPDGRAHFSIQSGLKRIDLTFGPKYPVAVVYAPPAPPGEEREFICIEPMAGLTNAVNLNHAGKYPDLQLLSPGAKWTESFWIRTAGL